MFAPGGAGTGVCQIDTPARLLEWRALSSIQMRFGIETKLIHQFLMLFLGALIVQFKRLLSLAESDASRKQFFLGKLAGLLIRYEVLNILGELLNLLNYLCRTVSHLVGIAAPWQSLPEILIRQLAAISHVRHRLKTETKCFCSSGWIVNPVKRRPDKTILKTRSKTNLVHLQIENLTGV